MSEDQLRHLRMSPDAADLVKEICAWVARNAETESAFLTPSPASTVNAHALLDEIHKLTGIPKEALGRWVDEGRNR